MLKNSPLKGYKIPHLTKRLLASLFADDTTVYLREDDHFLDLQDVLHTWCKVAGAKFNIEKTGIIPIGRSEFRENFLQTRKLNPRDSPIPQNIHIAVDGEPTRILGSWIGNQVDQADPWTPILEKTDKSLNQ
jgi:hypothetical protein